MSNSTDVCKVKSSKKKETVDFSQYLHDKVQGMKKLDRDQISATLEVSAVKCKSSSCGVIQTAFRPILMIRSNFRRVVSAAEYGEDWRLVILHPDVESTEQLNTQQKITLERENAELVKYKLLLTYSSFTFDEILRKVLPEDTKEIISSFETVGHIAHINLKTHLIEYKFLIGELLLDKNPNIKTVVNKTDSIEETFRFFHMELLAGEDKMTTSVQEHGCKFEFDYSKVYWNSRLHTEHQRIVNMLKPGDTVFDVFAGVGPFTVPAAKKHCIVYANDLNKDSYNSLLHNAKKNKVQDSIKAFNMDGQDFLEKIVIPNLITTDHEKKKHIVMNLPAIAPQFLSAFRDKYDNFNLPLSKCDNIVVHCYCFSKSKTPLVDAETIISDALGIDVSVNSETHFVRRVAPNKVMMCVSFKLHWFESNGSKCNCCSEVTVTKKRIYEGDFSATNGGPRKKEKQM